MDADPTPQEALEASAGALVAVLHDSNRVPGSYPTPLEGMTLAGLRDHVEQSVGLFARMLGTEGSGGSDGADAHAAAGGLPALTRAVVDAAAGADDDTQVELPAGTMTMAGARRIMALEMLVHAWDVAESTNTVLAVSEDLAEAVCSYAQELITDEHRTKGAFGTERPAPGDATHMERLAAFTGRDLDWRRAVGG